MVQNVEIDSHKRINRPDGDRERNSAAKSDGPPAAIDASDP
jgi:hypothetical protein